MNRRRFLRNSAGVLVPLSFGIITAAKGQNHFRLQQQIAAAGATAASGGGYVQEESFGATPDDSNAFASSAANIYYGHSFTPTKSYLLRRVAVELTLQSGTPSKDVTAKIYNSSAGAPTTQSGSDSAAVPAASIVSSNYNNFTFPSDISLTSGTKYYVVMYQELDAANGWSINSKDGATENAYISANGTSWSEICSSCLTITMKTYSFT